ncbi:MbcA/ParS/Xre antitoxin family protein [Paraburkholderia acidipaludis]|uniref:MbcA/ParS/Xre antitoxin family protein n=1 Tax=Paraburkholderia acidipaludis TaxID=660537 RepID=UPI001C3F1DCF|nr:MbcA/ParS/Xre antitoxin family protein [Paraburkholderia acidipaludis]
MMHVPLDGRIEIDAVNIPKHTSGADLSSLAKLVMTLFDRWDLSSEDKALLLGLAVGNQVALVHWTTREQYERVGHFLGIHKSLRLLFPHNRDAVYGWMKMRNGAFGGMTPVDIIKEYGFAGLLMVRAYLDHALRQ